MADANEPKLSDKLLAKISLQADDLMCLKNDVILKENRILELETQLSKCGFTPPAAGISDLAKRRKDEAKHKDQISALQKQLDTANKRLKESGLARNQLVVDLEHKARESRFLENKCDELQQENAKLLSRLEAVTLGEGNGPVKSPTALRARSQSLQGQLRAAKDELKLRDAEIDQLGLALEQEKMRGTTLEKALEYRADEIGLSGHADLLAKVAGFRGEVTALKKDLMDKRNRLHDIEAERQTVSESNLTLQQQVTQLQERLAQSRFELQRVQKGDSLIDQLKQVESERDVLLEFIQEDLRKNSDLTLATDRAVREAAEAQRMASSATAQLKKQEELVDSQASYIRDLENGRAALQSERAQARDQLSTATRESADLRARLERKEMEAQEQSKVNLSLLEQLKNKEDQLVSLTTNISTLRIQVEGQGSTNHRLLDERRELDAQVKALMAEMVPMREQALLYAASSQLRPEMESLQRDYNTVLIEKRSLLEEVQRLRFHDKQLQDLRTELEKVRQSTDSLSSPGNMSASQRHVMWTGIPALRQASPLLYDNIRSLFQDLFNKEAECRDLATQVKRFQDDQSYRDDDYRTDYQKMAEMEDRMNRRAAEDHSCIDTMERELVRARGARLAVEQLRSVLRSALGNATADYLRPPCIPNSRNNTPATQRRVGRQFRDPHDEELNGSSGAYEFDESFSIKKNEDLMNSSLEALAVAEIHEHFGTSRINHGYSADDILGTTSDEGLPALVSQVLARHMSSVAALDECERRYRDAAGERDRLSAVLSQVSAEAAGLRQRLADSKESSEGRESSYEDRYQKLKQDLEMAVSLNEKQNALTITLEAKVEELKRQLSVQSAQVISFQQQEEVFKHEFLKLLGNFWRSVSGKYGTLDVRRDNWFNLSHSDANRIDQIIQSAAEILSAVSCRLGGGAPQSQFRPGLPSSSTVGLGATPSRSPPPAEVSHHYRHWHSGGVTKSPLTKANQAYVEAVSRGLETNHSPSLLSRSLSQPFTREEFRRSGGSKSFTGLDERVSPQRLSLQRDSMGTSRDILAGNHSEILNRLQKAKTAYSFMRSDSLVDFQS